MSVLLQYCISVYKLFLTTSKGAHLKKTTAKQNPLSAIAWFFAQRYRVTSMFFIILLVMGSLFYSTFLKREGFPPINLPVSAVQGTYLVNDAAQVDREVVQPIARAIDTVDGVTDFSTTADSNFFSVIVQFDDDIDIDIATDNLSTAIKEQATLPSNTNYNVAAFNPSKFDNKYDLLLAVYDKRDSAYEDLSSKATAVAETITSKSEIESATPITVIESSTDPRNGTTVQQQTKINRVGIKEGDDLVFYPAISIGVNRSGTVDDIELSNAVQDATQNIQGQPQLDDIKTTITADFATTINKQISSLQNNLISGLIAVLVIALLLISWRAALVIALFIPTVLASTFLGLGLLGFTLNTITLFAVILTLGLFVDDATIMVEAIDSYKKEKRRHKDVIKRAIARVGIASLAGSLTTILVFTPMLFISGILGSFIRLLPLTVIIALVSSYIISIVVVPFLARPIVLAGKKQKGLLDKLSIFAPIEEKLGSFFGRLPLLHATDKKKSRIVSSLLVGLSIISIGGAALFAGKLSFNIFPPTKDSDILLTEIQFAPKTDIATANTITEQVDQTIKTTIGDELVAVTYLSADQRSATIEIELTPFQQRTLSSHDFIDKLSATGETVDGASVQYSQRDAGPPSQDYPFEMRVYVRNETDLDTVTTDIKNYLENQTIAVAGSSPTTITEVKIEGTQTISRANDGRFVTIKARFQNEEAGSSAVLNTRENIEKTYDSEKLASLNLAKDALDFDVSQESENAQSFNSVGTGLLVALALMYLLLVILFNSFSQPLLIFTAIPFSLFGVFFGLWLTDNSLSFFVMVGLLGLIGIVVNNSILLTEYANQEKAAGKDRYQAIGAAVKDRIRPLLTTTLTTVFALIPLALSDPFWQPLAYTLIFGMLSSTILIVLSFPYYYLGVERLREWKNNRFPNLR